MAEKNNQSQEKEDRDFGLPQGEFSPIECEGGRWFKVTAIIVGIVLSAGAGIVYWFFYRTPSADSFVSTRLTCEEHEIPKAEVNSIDGGASAAPQSMGESFQASRIPKQSDASTGAKENQGDYKKSLPEASRRGTITEITAPRGYYYVVVGSFIDSDLASDYASRLSKEGVDVVLITPPRGQYFSRVAIEQNERFRDTQEKVASLRGKYGSDVWILKY